MPIGPVEMNGLVSRTQDFSVMKQNEDNKSIIDHSNFQHQVDKSAQEKSTQVKHADDSDYREKRFDAKEKGNDQYAGNGGQNKSSKDSKEDKEDRVLMKRTGGFDIKI